MNNRIMHVRLSLGFYIICYNIASITSLPPITTPRYESAIDRFQDAVTKQTFQSILSSIEERLRNLDNIYSMQLSETLKTKIDQYHRKLETLDKKLIQLESIMMLNLDKISENISTKNYRDDIAKNQLYRKLDNIYDGLSHRISYLDKKHDVAFEKIQNKIETTNFRIEKVEEIMAQRHSDMENEFTDTQIILEELKNSIITNEDTITNVTAQILNHTLDNTEMIRTIQKSVLYLPVDFNTSFNKSLREIKNITTNNLNISLNSINLMSKIKSELKNDYNNYANKVADMSTQVWKKNDLLHKNLQVIETVTNSTIIEVQNGIRALMLQVGKVSGKEPINNGNSIESLKKSINLSFEKILANQGLFLESCHRVQMDESRIETEISSMLGKLLDMLEKKMTTVMKDLKNIEKSLKNHDSRIYRNLYQANTNIVSLFEKSTKHHEITERELEVIKFYVNSLFAFVQDVLPKCKDTNATSINGTLISLAEQINNLTTILKTDMAISEKDWLAAQIDKTKELQFHHIVIEHFKNITRLILSNKRDANLLNVEPKPKKCVQNYRHLIDVRYGDLPNCTDTDEFTPSLETLSKPKAANISDEELQKAILEIFGKPPVESQNKTIFNTYYENTQQIKSHNTTSNSTYTNIENGQDEELQKTILEIFGKPPDLTNNHNKTIPNTHYGNTQQIKIDNTTSNLTSINSENLLDEELQKAILEVFGKPPNLADNQNKAIPNNGHKNIQQIKINNATSNLSNNNTEIVPDEGLQKAILEIFGKPPDLIDNQVKKTQNMKKQKNKKGHCTSGKKCLKQKNKKNKLGVKIRFDDESYDYNVEDEDENESTTETINENYTVTTDNIHTTTTDLPQEVNE